MACHDGGGGSGPGWAPCEMHVFQFTSPCPKLAQIKTRRVHPQKARPRASLGEQKPMPLLRFVILKQSTDQRVGVSFVAEDEDELEYGAQRPALHGAAFT